MSQQDNNQNAENGIGENKSGILPHAWMRPGGPCVYCRRPHEEWKDKDEGCPARRIKEAGEFFDSKWFSMATIHEHDRMGPGDGCSQCVDVPPGFEAQAAEFWEWFPSAQDVLDKAIAWQHSHHMQSRAVDPSAPPLSRFECDLWNATSMLVARQAEDRIAKYVPEFSRGCCTRCNQRKLRVFYFPFGPSFLPLPCPPAVMRPDYETSCKECLKDEEIARMLFPIVEFVARAMLKAGKLKQHQAAAFGTVVGFLQDSTGNAMSMDQSRQKALDAI